MHVFPQLRKLEEKYARELVVVGVHSAKFTAEKDTQNLRKAILRYEIEHPVVNDADFTVWQQYRARAWPTLIFIDPEGKIIGKHEGEITLAPFEQAIGDMVDQFDRKSLIDRRSMKFKLEREKEWERPLSFPGKVLAEATLQRLFVADSNHNRLLITDLLGQVQEVVGSGERGLKDGDFAQAAFNDPQGMALVQGGEKLCVADTKNHAIREVDLVRKTVTTIAGTGEKAGMFHNGGQATGTALSSPWDLALHGSTLYIAMAGFHQLWRLELDTGEIRPHAGSGRERIVDGPLSFAQLAQPSGIVTNGHKLYFTDSETSAIRMADLESDGSVATIVGQDLFTFGDLDGTGDEVRLQHPLGIDMHEGVLFIADTYNNKVKRIFPNTRGAITLLGNGEAGFKDGSGTQAEFHEPGGLSISNGKLFVADTNNHEIRVAELDSQRVSTLELKRV